MVIAGLFVTPDYGMPWDEVLEIRTLGSNVREYIGLVQGERAEPVKSSTGISFPDYKKNVDMDHGQSMYYAFSPALFHDYGEGGERTLMILWHSYTFIIFMAGVVALYFICSALCGDWKYGALGSLFLYLSPRFFAEGHFNSKDIVTMSLALLCIWFGIKMVESKKFGYAILFALCGAIATNMRISAVFIFGLFGILYLIQLSVSKLWSKRHFFVGLTAILSFLVFFYVLTPAAWREPVDFISYTLTRSSDFSAWDGIVYFWGTIHRPVPSQYIPVMIGVTTPLLILLFILAGHVTTIISLVKDIKAKIFSKSTPVYILCIVYVWSFLVFAMIKQPILYNSWRHFYFLNGALLILAVGAVQFVVSHLKGKMKWIPIGAVAAQLVACLVIIILSHPFQYVYYNPLAGPDPAQGYEFDYWNVSQANLLMKLVDENPEVETFKISANDWYTDDGLRKAYEILPQEYQKRVKLFAFTGGPSPSAEYVIQNIMPEKIMELEKKYQKGFWIYIGNDFVPSKDCQKVATLTTQTSPFSKPVDFMTVYALGDPKN
jgi:MFS family permease